MHLAQPLQNAGSEAVFLRLFGIQNSFPAFYTAARHNVSATKFFWFVDSTLGEQATSGQHASRRRQTARHTDIQRILPAFVFQRPPAGITRAIHDRAYRGQINQTLADD